MAASPMPADSRPEMGTPSSVASDGSRAAAGGATPSSVGSPLGSPSPTKTKRKSESIRVVARFRPLSSKERSRNRMEVEIGDDGASCAVRLRDAAEMAASGRRTSTTSTGESPAAGVDPAHEFHLDAVLSGDVNNEELHSIVGRDAVRSLMEGFNGTLFAYGQTGSGKTHSLLGPDALDMRAAVAAGRAEVDDDRGVVPRVCADLFAAMESTPESEVSEFVVHASYLEVHNERVNDLLRPDSSGQNLKLRESRAAGTQVIGLTQEMVSSPVDFLDLLELGAKSRATAATKANERSSRSHCIFTIMLEAKLPDGSLRHSRLNLVDLAGAETVKSTGATGATLTEANKINASLTALGKCIKALSSKGDHVPFRDSKLTRLLKDSLGGNTRTTLLVCASQHHASFPMTVSTLRFAQRAKTVRTRVSVNVVRSPEQLMAVIKLMKKELTALKVENARLSGHAVPRIAEIANGGDEEDTSAASGTSEDSEGADAQALVEEARAATAAAQKRVAALESEVAQLREVSAAAAEAAAADAASRGDAELAALHKAVAAAERRAKDAEARCELLQKRYDGVVALGNRSRRRKGAGGDSSDADTSDSDDSYSDASAGAGAAGQSTARIAASSFRKGSVLASIHKRRGSTGAGGTGTEVADAAAAAATKGGVWGTVGGDIDLTAIKLKLSYWGARAVSELETPASKAAAGGRRPRTASSHSSRAGTPRSGWL